MKPFTVDSYKAGKKAWCKHIGEIKQISYFENTSDEGYCFAFANGDSIVLADRNGLNRGTTPGEYTLFEYEEPKPIVVTYHNVYSDGIGCSMTDKDFAIEFVCDRRNPINVIKITRDPNKSGSEAYTIEVVHKY